MASSFISKVSLILGTGDGFWEPSCVWILLHPVSEQVAHPGLWYRGDIRDLPRPLCGPVCGPDPATQTEGQMSGHHTRPGPWLTVHVSGRGNDKE